MKRLTDDETFKEVIEAVREKQINIFLNPTSTEEQVMEARGIIAAMGKIEDYISTVLADEKIYNRSQNK